MDDEALLELQRAPMDVISFREFVEGLTGVPYECIFFMPGENNAESNLG